MCIRDREEEARQEAKSLLIPSSAKFNQETIGRRKEINASLLILSDMSLQAQLKKKKTWIVKQVLPVLTCRHFLALLIQSLAVCEKEL